MINELLLGILGGIGCFLSMASLAASLIKYNSNKKKEKKKKRINRKDSGTNRKNDARTRKNTTETIIRNNGIKKYIE